MKKRFLIRINLFLDFINSLDLTDEEKEFVKEQVYSQDSLTRMPSLNYLPDQKSLDEFDSFMKYICFKSEELGIEYIKDALKYANTYMEDDNSYIEQFIKFIVITNFGEIEVYHNMSIDNKDDMYVVAYLGGLEISHNRNIRYDEENDVIEFEWFHNRKGLKRTKLGSLIMCNFFELTEQNFPNASIVANNVRKVNSGAINFYKKVGFDIIAPNVDSSLTCVQMKKEKLRESIEGLKGTYPQIKLENKIVDYTTYKTIDNKINKGVQAR